MSNLLFAAGLISYGQSSTTSLSASNPQKRNQPASPVDVVKGSSVDPVVKPEPVAKVQEPAVNSTNPELKIAAPVIKESLPVQSNSSTS